MINRNNSLLPFSDAVMISTFTSADYSPAESGNMQKIVIKIDTQHGKVFATENGLTLYTFKKDKKMKQTGTAAVPLNDPHFVQRELLKQ